MDNNPSSKGDNNEPENRYLFLKIPISMKDFKLPHDETVSDLMECNNFKDENNAFMLTVTIHNDIAVGIGEYGESNKISLFLQGHIQTEWDDCIPIYLNPADAEYEYGHLNDYEEDGEYSPIDFTETKFEDEFYVSPLRFVYDDGRERVRLVWTQALLRIERNPITLNYEHNQEYGRRFQTECNHFWLDHVDKGSAEQTREVLKHLQIFKEILSFQQIQKGGRLTGGRSRKTIQLYNRICNLRFSRNFVYKSDREFLDKYPEYGQSQLSRAKKWHRDGRPGL